MLYSFHMVADIGTQPEGSEPPAARLRSILDCGMIRPPGETREQEPTCYLAGLRRYVFFYYGEPVGYSLTPPVAIFRIDTGTLIRRFGGRVARRGCIDPEKVLAKIYPLDPVDYAEQAQIADPARWRRLFWPRCDEIIAEMTLGGDAAVEFLRGLRIGEESVDILVRGPVPLDEVERIK